MSETRFSNDSADMPSEEFDAVHRTFRRSAWGTLEGMAIHIGALAKARMRDRRTWFGVIAVFVLATLGTGYIAWNGAQAALNPANPLDELSGFLYHNNGCVAWIDLQYFQDPNHVPNGKQGVKITLDEPFGVAAESSQHLCRPGSNPAPSATGGAATMTGYIAGIHGTTRIVGYYYQTETHNGPTVHGKPTSITTQVYISITVDMSFAWNGDSVYPIGSYLYFTESDWSDVYTFHAASIAQRDAAFSTIAPNS